MIRFFDPAKSYLAHKQELDAAMQDVLARGDLILRKDVEEFEENLAKYVGTKYAIGVASGTDALILSLVAAGLQKGDKVLVPSYSFRATVEAVVHAGGIPVMYDLNNPSTSEKDIKFWIPAHIAGEVTFSEKDHETALYHNIKIVEDACQAIGAAPIRGLTACYSFYPAKLLGCFGDGGGIATNDKDLYEKLKILRNHNKGKWDEVGYNSRLDNLQAAVLNVKIKYLPYSIARRKLIAQAYDEGLKFVKKPTVRSHYQDYIIETSDVKGLKLFLETKGIETMENGYPYPDIAPKGPLTLAYEARTLRIPCNENITDDEVRYIIEQINEYTR